MHIICGAWGVCGLGRGHFYLIKTYFLGLNLAGLMDSI